MVSTSWYHIWGTVRKAIHLKFDKRRIWNCKIVVDNDDKDKQTLCQMAEEANVVVDKRWREVVDRHMARFKEMTKGLVDAQVRGT